MRIITSENKWMNNYIMAFTDEPLHKVQGQIRKGERKLYSHPPSNFAWENIWDILAVTKMKEDLRLGQNLVFPLAKVWGVVHSWKSCLDFMNLPNAAGIRVKLWSTPLMKYYSVPSNSTRNDAHLPPASSNNTLTVGSSDSRDAKTQPLVPPPTII